MIASCVIGLAPKAGLRVLMSTLPPVEPSDDEKQDETEQDGSLTFGHDDDDAESCSCTARTQKTSNVVGLRAMTALLNQIILHKVL